MTLATFKRARGRVASAVACFVLLWQGTAAHATAQAAAATSTAATSASANSTALAAQQPSGQVAPVQSARLEKGEQLLLDGSLSHPAWARAPAFSAFVERGPTNGAVPQYETRVQVLVAETALYVGITALDPRPELIRSELVRHDQVKRTMDFVGVYIDSVGLRKRAQFFRVSAAGSTADGQHTADDDNEDFSPDYDFEAKSQRTAQGYTAVLRIPFASLRFTGEGAKSGVQPWRMMVVRRVPREQNFLLLSVPMSLNANNFIEALQPIYGVESPSDTSFLQLRPNITVRRSTETQPGMPDVGDSNINLGLELKWRPRPELVVDMTLKPDFSQVELDTPQLSRNNLFALYLQEKRPFFLESSDLLRSPTDALYTRSVTLPRWGLRASLRTDAASGTLFAAHDMGGGQVLLPGAYGTGAVSQPQSDVLISRVRVDRGALTLGGIASARSYADGRGDNIVIGPDLTWQATPSLRLRAQLTGSRTTAWADEAGSLAKQAARDGSQFFGTAFWRADPYEVSLLLEDVSKDYRNDNGFVSQNGFRHVYFDAHRVWRNLKPFNEIWLNFDAQSIVDRDTGETISSQVTPRVYASYSNGSEVNLSYRGLNRQRVSSGSPILQERFWRFNHTRTWAGWAPQVNLSLDWGELADYSANTVRPGRRVSVDGMLRPLRSVELTPEVSMVELQRPASQGGSGVTYRETAAQLLAVWHLAPQQVLRLIVQRSSVDRRPEPTLSPYSDRGQTDSLTYIWRKTLGTSFNVGVVRASSGIAPNVTRNNEIFAKWQVDVDEWRAR